MKKPGSRGLSGEHIELCAEGARQKPNLSGKRTETQDIDYLRRAVLVRAALFCLQEKERGNCYAEETH